MFLCDLMGLIGFLEKIKDINTSDASYLYTVMTRVLSINNHVIILQGKTDIPSLKKGFKVSDRTNVLRILDRLVKTGLLKYTLAESRGNESVYITIKEECAQYFFKNKFSL